MKNEDVKTLEKGNIFFFYRPKIDVKADISSANDVQNFYCLLSPQGNKEFRLIIIGKEHLPNISKKEKLWGFVSKASRSKNQIKKELQSFTYETKTRGKREQPAARPCGEGVYRIVQHEDHCHLVYALELPDEPKKVQKALKIPEEGSYIISIKNPEKGQPKNAGLGKDQKAKFPKKLQSKFKDRKFIPASPPTFLNYQYAEILFIGASKDVKKELGMKLNPENETEKEADIFKALSLDKEEHPLEALFEGEWV
ncbi:MAG: hypothetical protein H0X62_07770 [Bacteroidetes bacterium]|nr:hypothetical protein [Bacteroidota bacterium]